MNRSELLRLNGFVREPGGDRGDGDNVLNVMDWHACDVDVDVDVDVDEDDADDDDDHSDDGDGDGDGFRRKKKFREQRFVIYAFGVRRDGTSACVQIDGFPPYFFVQLESISNGTRGTCGGAGRAAVEATHQLVKYLRLNIQDKSVKVDIVLDRKNYWGLNDDTPTPFVRLMFTSWRAMRFTSFRLRSNEVAPGKHLPHNMRVKLFESNIAPLLRFVHHRNIAPAGWVRVPASAWVRDARTVASKTTCQAFARCDWRSVVPAADQVGIAPAVICSFDIECTSAHGDFPMAVKDYSRLATDIEQMWDIDKLGKAREYHAKQLLVSAIGYAVGQMPTLTHTTCPIARLQHKRAGVVASAGLLQAVHRSADDAFAILRASAKAPSAAAAAAAADASDGGSGSGSGSGSVIESLTRAFNAIFGGSWPLRGDPVIQIGTTLGVYGSTAGDCTSRVIFTLGTCEKRADDDAPDRRIVVREFESEARMLLEWLELVRAVDPDVVTGYNILGFDMAYIHARAGELGLSNETSDTSQMYRFGRVNAHASKFVVKEMSSSAMGDNVLRYYDMHGRVYVDLLKVVQREHRLDSYKLNSVAEHFLGERKNDVTPNDIFRLQRGTATDRRVIADYCIQDCELCNRLVGKLETVANSIGMANVCLVPLSYIFMRGQGIKIFSLVAKHCRDQAYIIPEIRAADGEGGDGEEEGYEGAIVLEPERGMHLETPVSVLDYNSLYPSAMISHNISQNTLVMRPELYGTLPHVEYVTVTYDCYEGKGGEKRVVGKRTCRFATKRHGQPCDGVLPGILKSLLAQRKATRARAAEAAAASDKFRYAILDGLQLAYKITANSLYGQMGAVTSQLYLKDIAACTTAVGRDMIMLAKEFVETKFGAHVVYGDTDSLFLTFPEAAPDTHDKTPEGYRGAVARSIEAGQRVSAAIKPLLPPPHHLEYEKTFFPFVLLSKKRYVGLVYGDDANAAPKQKSMGNVLNRRDSAPIVKKIYGGIVRHVLEDRNIPLAVEYLRSQLRALVDGQYDLDDLVISKTLKSTYKFPQRIAHVVLARRMHDRDPGSAPQVNDRLPYVFVQSRKHNALMGERIEHIDYVRANLGTVAIDTLLYIQSQIMNPCLQILAIGLEIIPGYRRDAALTAPGALEALVEVKKGNALKAEERLKNLREAEVRRMVFDPITEPLARAFMERVSEDARVQHNRANRQSEITRYFSCQE